MQDLKPGAFRVWDAVEGRYWVDSGDTIFHLDSDGDLALWETIPGEYGMSPALFDRGRYTVERWTGLMDREGTAIYENDALLRITRPGRVYAGFTIYTVQTKGARFWAVDELGCPMDSQFFSRFLVIGTAHDEVGRLKAGAESRLAEHLAEVEVEGIAHG